MFSQHRPRGRVVASLALALATGACSDGEASESSSPTTTAHDHAPGEGAHDHDLAADKDANKPDVDPCLLVTKDELTSVLGPIASMTEDHVLAVGVVSEQRVCMATIAADARFGVNVGLANRNATTKFDALEDKLAVGTPVPELGDRALWFRPFQLLVVHSGDGFVSVQLREISQDEAAAEDRATRIARFAADRMAELLAAAGDEDS